MITVVLSYNELGYNENSVTTKRFLCPDRPPSLFNVNMLGYNDLGFNENSVTTKRFLCPKRSFCTEKCSVTLKLINTGDINGRLITDLLSPNTIIAQSSSINRNWSVIAPGLL